MFGAGYSPPREVYGDLDRVVRPDLFYHYSTPICAQRWMDVCEDPGYGHGALLEAISGIMPDVVACLKEDDAGARSVELLSLGPGDGSVDERILWGFAAGLRPTSYTGLDFSFELLRRAVNRIAHSPGIPDEMTVRAVCGDFNDLGGLALPPTAAGAVRVFALTGFTLGNYRESAVLGSIKSMMAPGDYLFLDARLHKLGPLPADLTELQQSMRNGRAGYETDSVRRFVLGPVEVATTVEASSLPVEIELRRTLTEVPNGLNLVLYCANLDTALRLTGERVRRDRVDLAVTSSYHAPDLVKWLEGSGLCLRWHSAIGDVAFFLLRA